MLGGRPLLEWSLEVLDAVCDRVVVALPPGHEDIAGPDRVAGGASRSESVARALEAAPEANVAVVHDSARPLLTHELVERCIAALSGSFDGAIAAAPVTDTVKVVEGHRVIRTPERSALWAVQTPQVFRAEALRAALATGDLSAATDDASLVEAAGGRVRVVEAPAENLKVTTALDLRVAEMLIAERP